MWLLLRAHRALIAAAWHHHHRHHYNGNLYHCHNYHHHQYIKIFVIIIVRVSLRLLSIDRIWLKLHDQISLITEYMLYLDAMINMVSSSSGAMLMACPAWGPLDKGGRISKIMSCLHNKDMLICLDNSINIICTSPQHRIRLLLSLHALLLLTYARHE